MAESKKKKAKNLGAWAIMGLLFFGLIGFSAGSFGGGGQTIGTIGEKRISAQTYFSALQSSILNYEQRTGTNISLPEAQALGIQQDALSQIVNQRAIDNEATRLGLSVGDAQVRDQILSSGFVGLDGQFDRVLYAESLRRNGLTEGTYETQIREALSRQALQTAVVGGIVAPELFIDTLLDYTLEERRFAWARMGEDDLITPLPEPTDDELRAEYASNPGAYTLPESKRITYAWLTPDMILDSVEVDEDALRTLFGERFSQFNRPERRLVERLVFGSTMEADAALARINEGGSFEEEVEARGLTLSDIDLGDVLPSDLGDAGTAVFAVTDLTIVGPLDTSLGPALFRVNAILPAQTTTFEDARPGLQNELALDRSARIVTEQIETLENELAGGATIEELAELSDMELGTINWFPGQDEGIAAYAAFQNAAAAVSEADFPEIAELDDGGIFAIRLVEVIPPALQPFDDVRATVIEAWRATATVDAVTDLAMRLSPQIAAGMDMATLGLDATIEEGLTRRTFLLGTPPGFLDTVFEMEPGDVEIVPGDGEIMLVRLDGVQEADRSSPDSAALVGTFERQIASSYAQDIFATYSAGILDDTTIRLDQTQINAIHTQIQ